MQVSKCIIYVLYQIVKKIYSSLCHCSYRKYPRTISNCHNIFKCPCICLKIFTKRQCRFRQWIFQRYPNSSQYGRVYFEKTRESFIYHERKGMLSSSSLSSSLFFLLLLNNHIQIITLANKYQHRNSSGNNNNTWFYCAFQKCYLLYHSVCAYTLDYVKCLWYLGNCTYKGKKAARTTDDFLYHLLRSYWNINLFTVAIEV